MGMDRGEDRERGYSDGVDEEGELWMRWANIAIISASLLSFPVPIAIRRR